LTPENVIINSDGYIKITDFGLAKENINKENKAISFCGTPEYLAPEILDRVPYDQSVDWWSFGVILYEMLTGHPPFYSSNREKLFKSIQKISVQYPIDISPDAKSLLKNIFVREKRLGVEEIKSHPFFAEINWESILQKRIKPPFIPKLKSNFDTKYIDSEFLSEQPCDSYNKGDTIDTKDDLFKDFSKSYGESLLKIENDKKQEKSNPNDFKISVLENRVSNNKSI
jgi:serine/threonine protein kinase